MSDKVNIDARFTPCRCGCKGKDPWHAATFRRVVHDQVPVRDGPEKQGRVGRLTWRVVARGRARFPWGDEEVLRVEAGTVSSWMLPDAARSLGLPL